MPRAVAAENRSREKININAFWKYRQGDISEAQEPAFDDSTWQTIGLPHSFSIPYFLSPDFYVGYGWYRKRLQLPGSISGKRGSLEFDGVFQEAEVFVNGKRAGGHKGGYTGFTVDITSAAKPGGNLIAVCANNLWNPRVAPRAGEHVFSGGIYRNVYLVITDALHVDWYGTFVTTPQASPNHATVNVRTDVVNQSGRRRSATVRQQILDPDGKVAAEFSATRTIDAGAKATFDMSGPEIRNPRLWSPDQPSNRGRMCGSSARPSRRRLRPSGATIPRSPAVRWRAISARPPPTATRRRTGNPPATTPRLAGPSMPNGSSQFRGCG
jgi:beta-galactosidase/beta-glucuronidase